VEKSEEQIDADRKLTEAVEECMRVYVGDEVQKYVLGDFVVLSAIQMLTEDGILVTRYPVFLRDGDLPWYRVFGLIDMSKIQLEKHATGTEDNG